MRNEPFPDQKMKAVRMRDCGTPDVLSHDLIDVPAMGPTDVSSVCGLSQSIRTI